MRSHVVRALNGLIETLKDCKQVLETAASQVTDHEVQAVLQHLSRQRSRFAGELQVEVKRLRGEPEMNGSVGAVLQRGWIELKGALGAGQQSILDEANIGEQAAMASYERALEGHLPQAIATLLHRQYGEVRKAHDQIDQLRAAMK